MDKVVRAKSSFRDIKQQIVNRINSRDWVPGNLLPSEIELAERYGCARATVSRALNELAEEGVVSRKRRAGTRINTTPVRQIRFDLGTTKHEVLKSGAIYRYAPIKSHQQTTPDWLRVRAGFGSADEVLYLQSMHYSDNSPFMFEECWLNMTQFDGVESVDFSTNAPEEWLSNLMPLAKGHICISARLVDELLSSFLLAEVGSAILGRDCTVKNNGRTVAFGRRAYRQGYCMGTSL